MTLFILTFLIIGLSMLGMAVGLLVSGRPVRRGCCGDENGGSGCPDCSGQCSEGRG